MLDWLIIGGGVCGTHIALSLTLRGGVSRHRIRVLDPHERLMQQWTTRSTRVGMQYLRSPAAHHAALEPDALIRFAEALHWQRAFVPPYSRPACGLFDRFHHELIERERLSALHHRGTATAARPYRFGWRIETADGALDARRLVLAPGPGDTGKRPAWAQVLAPSRAQHVFDPDFVEPHANAIAVVGGGLSAVSYALAACKPGRRVVLVSRHETRVHQFDSDPGWLGPRYLDRFATQSLAERRSLIDRARRLGSVPEDTAEALGQAVAKKKLCVVRDEVVRAVASGDSIVLETPSLAVRCEHVVLATGFPRTRPGGKLVDDLVQSGSLPLAPCGFPSVDPLLHWGSGVYAAGGLAELELGPAARNISGARMSAERIVRAARGDEAEPRRQTLPGLA